MDKVKILFEDMSYGMVYQFLDEGKDKDELTKIGKRNGMVLPSPDLAIFKGKYAFVDEQNKNKCTLPRDEVVKALKTLNHKAVDVDHLRRSVVGHWLEASLDGDEIIAYGCFLKNNFKEEYAEFKAKMENGEIKISFEAWGTREHTSDGYNLRNIHFAGGALLDKENPAFSDTKVLEFAKIMETGEGNEEEKEISRYYIYDMQSILSALRQVECPICKEKGYLEINKIDFENNKLVAVCIDCKTVLEVNLTPSTKILKKGRKIKSVAIIKSSVDISDEFIDKYKGSIEELEKVIINELEDNNIEGRKELADDMFAIIKTKETGKIRLFPINDKVNAETALARLDNGNVKQIFSKIGISVIDLKGKILKRVQELNTKEKQGGIKMNLEEKIKELETALKAVIEAKEKLETKVKDYEKEDAVKSLLVKEEEVTALKASIGDLTKKVESFKTIEADLTEAKKVRDEYKVKLDEIEETKKQALIKSRRDEIGKDIAKDVSDEDILKDEVFENLKLKKENAELRKENPEKAKALEAGSTDRTSETDDLAVRIQKSAWGE